MPPKHFTLIRAFQVSDFLTLGNGCCGIVAIFHALRFVADGQARDLTIAATLIPLAFVFDVFDGRVARWRRTASALGRELDSLADVISFGVAPAAIAFAVGLNTGLDQAGLTYFVLCGLSRLARYNITASDLSDESGKVRYFEGAPIPTSLVPLFVLLAAYRQDSLGVTSLAGMPVHASVLLFVISGTLMISKTLRIPKP